jgi:hypothetical protein
VTDDGFPVDSSYVGTPDEWEDFARRNPLFVGGRDLLENTFASVLYREIADATGVDQFIFLSASHAVDDFSEIIILAANGEGYGAIKLLRPMFERVVTMKYLRQNPDRYVDYVGYAYVDRYKLARVVERTIGGEAIAPDVMRGITESFEAIRHKFQKKCSKCGQAVDKLPYQTC